MNKIIFSDKAWNEYIYWQSQDKKTLKRINLLIKDIAQNIGNNLDGIGKPEALKHNLNGYFSRRIDDVNRIVYKITDEQIEIIQCKGHYND